MAEQCEMPGQLDMWEKGMAAGSAAVISTLVANPLELVKVRCGILARADGLTYSAVMLFGS